MIETVLILGSSLNSKLNSFLKITTDLLGLIIPEQFKFTVLSIISKETFVRAVLEPSFFRIYNNFLILLKTLVTSIPTTIQLSLLQKKANNILLKTNMLIFLSLSVFK